jgi:hypothetical protein
MRNRRVWVCAAVVVSVVAASGLGNTRPSLGRVTDPPPSAHLGYGINVRFQQHVESLFAPLGFEWLKLWEEYDSLPTARYPYQVLFLVDCYGRSGDLQAWRDDVRAIASAGKGLVEAYEICNEPNFAQWVNKGVDPHVPPDPALYVQMLQVAYETIKEVDPAAIVVSAGLAPVGRIQGTCNGWSGNDCSTMDEREYARQMLLLGAGDYLDAFGYHPYGFAYSPEADPYSVSNGFAFRGAEVMHTILEDRGLGDTQIWATEFSWLRDPSYDPAPAGWCHLVAEYENNFGWMDMSEASQADFFTRAFQYADEHWPWMGALIVWNLDWYDYNWLCEPSRYFSVRKNDGSDLGSPALAYDALATMEKRPGHFGPRLAITPTLLSFQAEEAEPQVFEGVVTPLNTGYRVFTWTASVDVSMSLTPTLPVTTGVQGSPLTITVDSGEYGAGMFTGTVTVTSTTTGVLDVPQTVTVTLAVEPSQPRLAVRPDSLVFLADVDEPGVKTATLWPQNAGGGVLTWTAEVVQGMPVVPALGAITGSQGTPLAVMVDSTGYPLGTFAGAITINAVPPDTLNTPQMIPVTLMVVPEVYRMYLPLALRSEP